MLLDFAPLPIFLIAYHFGGIYVATGALIVSLYVALAIDRLISGKLNKVLAGTALLATVLGGFTFALHDPSFIKLKPTIIYSVFAGVCIGSHFIGRQVMVQRLMQSNLQLPDAAWKKLNLAYAAFFAFCAVLNYYIAHHFAEEVWVKFKGYGLIGLFLAFALLQVPFLARYLPDEAAQEKQPPSTPAP